MDTLRLDHIVYAAPDLYVAVDDLEKRLGVRASPGGRHEGLGTRNALLSFSEEAYLEVIGPDPEQGQPAMPRPFGIDSLAAGRLVTWAAKESDLEARIEAARAADYDPGDAIPVSRATPDGRRLEWRLTMRPTPGGAGLVPFLIDWEASRHPAPDAARGCCLVSLRGEHPDPDRVRAQLDALGAQLPLTRVPEVALVAVLDTPNGRVELR